MLRVMEAFMEAHPVLPGEIQTHVFIQSHAVQQALMPFRHLLPPHLRGLNARIGEER